MKTIKEVVKPENSIEEAIIIDEEFIKGALYGKPRQHHPEGEVINHIEEVLSNVDKFSDTSNRKELRLITIVHDSFKFKVDQDKPKSGNNHHAMIARRFSERYITDKNVLDIIELHDEAYNAWQQGNRKNDWREAERRANKLIRRLGNNLSLFLVFFKCDTLTGTKIVGSLTWFEDFVSKLKENEGF
jgi:hypothetical protein